MPKKGNKAKRGARNSDYVTVLIPMVIEYMFRLGLSREDLALGAGPSVSTVNRMFKRGRVRLGPGREILQFLQECVRKRNEEIAKENTGRDDSQKEELIPMITSLSEWPAEFKAGGTLDAVVSETAGVDTGQMADGCRNAVAECPAMGVLEHSIRELVKTSLAAEKGPKGGLYVIRVAPDESMSVVEIGDSSSVQPDAGREACLRGMMEVRLRWERNTGRRHGKPKRREFTAYISAEEWVSIVETTAQSPGASLRHVALIGKERLFAFVHPDHDDRSAWRRFQKEVRKLDLNRLRCVDGHGSKAGEPGS